MISDSIKLKGRLKFILTNTLTGKETIISYDNLVVSTGKNLIASRLTSNASSPLGFIALGSGTATKSLSDISLQTEITPRLSTMVSVNQNVISFSGTSLPGQNTGTISEAGILNAMTGGILFSRTTFPAFTKSDVDDLLIFWEITVV